MLAKHFASGATAGQEHWVRHEVQKFIASRKLNEGNLKSFDDWVTGEVARKNESGEWESHQLEEAEPPADDYDDGATTAGV